MPNTASRPPPSACRFRVAFPTSKPPACPKPFTVWSNVFDRGRLAEGEALLVHGGASGIGTTAIQLARAMGNPVYATVGSDERARAVEALGAARGINYKTQDFVKEVLDATGGRGVDVVLDMVAGDYIGRDIQCLADDGRIVIIAQLGGAHANVDTAQVMRRRLTITGSTLRPRPLPSRAPSPARCASALAVAGAGRHRPIVRHLPAPGRGRAMMESGENIGKIILTV